MCSFLVAVRFLRCFFGKTLLYISSVVTGDNNFLNSRNTITDLKGPKENPLFSFASSNSFESVDSSYKIL